MLLHPETEYVGLDIAESEQQSGYAAPDTIHFDGGRWPQGARNADFVLCTETLEHVLDPPAFLAEAFASLRPGGRLFLTVPFAAGWHFVPYDYWRFTPSSLKHLLEKAGFRDVVASARGNELTVACYKAMALFLPFFVPQGAGRGRQKRGRCGCCPARGYRCSSGWPWPRICRCAGRAPTSVSATR